MMHINRVQFEMKYTHKTVYLMIDREGSFPDNKKYEYEY